MLARGAICRLAANASKTTTHDLPRISQQLQTTLFARHGASQPTVGATARAFEAMTLESRRAYATQSATEPTQRVKKEVKKAVAKKSATTKATKAAPKKAKKKAAKKAAPKKPAKKPKKVKTAEEKEAEKIRELKKIALVAPSRGTNSAWTVFLAESFKGAEIKGIEQSQAVFKETAPKYKNLTPAEREHYNQIARQQNEVLQAEHKKWLLSHTPEQIQAANTARAALKRKAKAKGAQYKGLKRYSKLEDERLPSSRPSPFIQFSVDRGASGDFKGIPVPERAKLLGNEWKALSESEKKVYVDRS